MAEIKIEKKKPVWPWILLGLLILAIILYFVFAETDTRDDVDDTDDREQVEDTTYTSNQRNNNTTKWEAASANPGGEVENYITYIEDETRMGVDHEYTNNALLHLINAVETKAREVNVDVDTSIQKMREEARAITQNPQGTNHATKIKNVGEQIADALEDIQDKKYPNLSNEVEEVKIAAQEIESTTLTLDQKEKIQLFFSQAADVLKKMS